MSTTNRKNESFSEKVGETIAQGESFLLKFKGYQNHLVYGLGGLLILIAGYFAYNEFVVKPKEMEAQKQIFQAERNFSQDLYKEALSGDGNTLGFLSVIENYGGTATGNLARFYAGICQMHLGEFEAAIENLKKFNSKDEILSARALCNIGDCYAELNNADEALNYFLKAAKHRDNSFAAAYLMKATAVYELQGKYEEALKLYEQIKHNYSKSPEANDIEKYIGRAQMLSTK